MQSSAGEVPLEAASRNPTPWSDDEKRAHIRRGYDLLEEARRVVARGRVFVQGWWHKRTRMN